MSEIQIRPFDAADRARVEAFFDQMGGETRAFFNRNNGNERRALAFFDGTSKHTDHFLAEEDGRMVGYVFLYHTDTSVPDLGIAVSEDYKGKHLGRRLIQCAIDCARVCGKGGIMLTTHVANLRGQALYERMGFEHLGTHKSGELLYLLRLNAHEAV